MRYAILKTFTVLWLFGMYMMLLVTFMVAYQSPEKTVRVTIDKHNEAEVEFFMLTGALFVSTMGTLFLMADIRRDYHQRISSRTDERLRASAPPRHRS